MSEELEQQVRQRLACSGRTALKRSEFLNEDQLLLSFRQQQLDSEGVFKPELFQLPDISCNWRRFSEPIDVRFRENGRQTDGCAAIFVRDVCLDDFAVAVHDPLCNRQIENYSHCEIRLNPGGLGVDEEPPQKLGKGQRAKRNAWGKNLILNSKILIPADA